MPPYYKLSPAFIAMLLDNKRRASPPDPPLSDDSVQRPEPAFTPLEEILGERSVTSPSTQPEYKGLFNYRNEEGPGFANGLSNYMDMKGGSQAAADADLQFGRERVINAIVSDLNGDPAALRKYAAHMQKASVPSERVQALIDGLNAAAAANDPIVVTAPRDYLKYYPWLNAQLAKDYSDGKQDFMHPVASNSPQLISGSGYTMSPLDRFNAHMAPRTDGGLITAMAAAINPNADFTLTRQADDLFLALGGAAGARAGQGASVLGNNGAPAMPIYGGRTYTAPYYERNSGITPGMAVTRNFGGEADLYRQSWTDVPFRAQTRYGLGMPNGNTGTYTAFGEIISPDRAYYRDALPLDGNAGGAREIVIPDPHRQVRTRGVHTRDFPVP
jgi:hypothetical protein